MRCCMFQLSVCCLELCVVLTSTRLEMTIVDEQDGDNAEHCDGEDGDDDRQPALVESTGSDTERSGAELRSRHGCVVHATDGGAHDERGTDAGEMHEPGAAFAEAET